MQKKFSKKKIEQIGKIYSEWNKKLQLKGKNYNDSLLIIIRASGRYLDIYEEWRDIPEYEELYKVSNFGRVKSLSRLKTNKQGIYQTKEIILKPGKGTDGYLLVCLHNKDKVSKTLKIHQLVPLVFLGHIPNGYKLVVNHKNFIKTDNNLSNLEIVTHRENTSYRSKKSYSQYTGVCYVKPTNKWRAKMMINGVRVHLGIFDNEYDAHLAYTNKLKSINN